LRSGDMAVVRYADGTGLYGRVDSFGRCPDCGADLVFVNAGDAAGRQEQAKRIPCEKPSGQHEVEVEFHPDYCKGGKIVEGEPEAEAVR